MSEENHIFRSAINPDKSWLILLLFLNGIIYGMHFVANKWAVDSGIPVFAYIFWYSFIAGVILLLLCICLREFPKLSPKSLFVFAVMGTTGIAAPLALLTWTASKLPAGVIGLVVVMSPVFTYIFSTVLKIEKFAWLRVLGILIGFGSVLLVYLPDASLPDPSMASWLLIALIAPICFAATNVFAAIIRPPKVSSLALSAGILLGGSLVMLPIMLISGEYWIPPADMMLGNYALITAILINLAIWWMFLEIVRNAGPVFFTPSNYVIVLSSIGWGVVIFGEKPSIFIWGAVIMMFAGVFLVNYGQIKKKS
ncbi:MAG: hypothetical protein CMM30_00330 [Rhodospirillaceae bacterium]|nr:hypothetical protein [Rhodospirillaceae bacterium]|tara:strand:- start:4745 stop:5674 length:930 start_codon:yes stop_codon:yes gene_type:complete